MSVRGCAYADDVVLTYEAGSTTVSAVGATLHEAVAKLLSRFGEMQAECIAQLEKLGVRVQMDSPVPIERKAVLS